MVTEPAEEIVSSSPVSDDHALVGRVLRGELSAFEPLVERHREVAFRVAQRIVGPDDADDVTQDAFLRAFHKLSTFRGDATFRSWLLTIVQRTALNRRQVRSAAPMEVEAIAEAVAAEAPAPRTPADSLEEEERRERLALKLRGLSPSHRTVLVLRDLEGLTYEEIAQITESPLGSVKGRLHRARAELVEVLRNNTYDWNLPDA